MFARGTLAMKDVVVLLVAGLFVVLSIAAATCLASQWKRRLLCMAQVRLSTHGLLLHAEDNDGDVTINDAGYWPWDLSYSGTDRLSEYGITPAMLYCPSDPSKSHRKPQYWQYPQIYGQNPPFQMVEEPLSPQARKSYYRVVGYFWLVETSAHAPSPRPFQIQGEPERYWLRNVGQVQTPATWELLTDATLSTGMDPTTASFSRVEGGMYGWLGVYDRTNHLDGYERPQGGNIGFVDGHAEWRPFARMQFRSSHSWRPCHWW